MGFRPRGAAGGVLRLHGGDEGVLRGSLMGAEPFLQTESEEGILSVGLVPRRERGGVVVVVSASMEVET